MQGRRGRRHAGPHGPEQVRGEGHRLDGRTDVWALGVVLYQGLTGRLPFAGRDRAAIFEEIIRREPRPPRQIDDAIPGELERICLKCLSKRMTDRYGSRGGPGRGPPGLARRRSIPGRGGPPTRRIGRRPMRRSRPGSSPRGCGPSTRRTPTSSWTCCPARGTATACPSASASGRPGSRSGRGRDLQRRPALRALGLRQVVAGQGRAAAPAGRGRRGRLRRGRRRTRRARLLRGLRKRLPGLPGDLGLVETLASLRRRRRRRAQGPRRARPVRAVAARPGGEPEIGAGPRPAAVRRRARPGLVLVRDDFGMAATRFMGDAGSPDRRGAQLRHGRPLRPRPRPEGAGAIRPGLRQAARGPARPDRRAGAVPRPRSPPAWRGTARSSRCGWPCSPRWSRASPGPRPPWRRSGGTEGVGVRSWRRPSARGGQPRHRLHQKAARAVLKALLPEAARTSRGRCAPPRSCGRPPGYRRTPAQFEDLLRVLDGELRLITPTDHSESLPDPGDDPSSKW